MLKFLDRVCEWGLIAILVLAPTQHGFTPVADLTLCVVDPVVALVAAAWGARLLLRRRLGDLCPPPAAVLLFLGLAVVSAIVSGSRLAAAKDLIQLAEYFVAGWLLFADALAGPARRRSLTTVFLGVASAVVAVGLVQYLAPWPDGTGFAVRGTFGNRNVFGGYLALVLPLAWAGVLFETTRWRRVWLLVLVLAGVLVCLSGAALLALVVAFGLVAVLKGTRALIALAAAAALWFSWGWHHLPRDNAAAAYESLALYRDDGNPARRYPEWQAAVDMTQEQPWFGVGLGAYQARIGGYYGVLPVEAHKAEADSQNLYLVLASSVGLPGMFCFAALLLQALVRGVRGMGSTAADGRERALAAGAAGSVLAFALNSVWAPLLVRGIGLPLVFVLCLAWAPRPDVDEAANG